MSFELPTELWVQISQDLPRDAISKLSTVSTLFRSILLPLLFQELEVTPYRIDIPSDPQKVLKRLEFLSSDEIAPMIIKFSLDLRITGSGDRWAVIELDSPDELIAATFRTITHFKKIRHLSCAFDGFFIVDISRLGFEVLPGLDYLTIRSGGILSVTSDVFTLEQEHGSIALFPALHNLTITGRMAERKHTLEFGTSMCPLLEHFTGSCTVLPRVLPGTSCTSLTLDPCTPDELLQAVRQIGHMPSITTVTLRLSPRHLPAWSTAQAVWELFPGVVNLQLNMMLHGNSPESQVHTQESLLRIFIEILGAPTALEQATIRWNPEDEIMGMLHGLDSRLHRAVPGLHSLYLDGGSRLPCPATWDVVEPMLVAETTTPVTDIELPLFPFNREL
ncbi:hypothetical protein B0H13DRAFT_2537953 [Mycena leptocephala]|nr:hypothetical protein B0H13DRAFT_2537953 [Mycena leptocephala]